MLTRWCCSIELCHAALMSFITKKEHVLAVLLNFSKQNLTITECKPFWEDLLWNCNMAGTQTSLRKYDARGTVSFVEPKFAIVKPYEPNLVWQPTCQNSLAEIHTYNVQGELRSKRKQWYLMDEDQHPLWEQITHDDGQMFHWQCSTPTMRAMPAAMGYQFIVTALNLAAKEKSKERCTYGWRLLHHTLQPCSVCGMLLTIKTDEDGEIISSGTGRFNPYTDFPTQAVITPVGSSKGHLDCYAGHLQWARATFSDYALLQCLIARAAGRC